MMMVLSDSTCDEDVKLRNIDSYEVRSSTSPFLPVDCAIDICDDRLGSGLVLTPGVIGGILKYWIQVDKPGSELKTGKLMLITLDFQLGFSRCFFLQWAV